MARHVNVFISYARRDQLLARKLAKALEAHGVRAWYDALIQPGGDDWASEIARALDAADGLVWLCSPEWANASSTQHEIEQALSGDRFAERVFPIVVRRGGRYPWILRRYEVADLSDQAPTAAKIDELARTIAERFEHQEGKTRRASRR